MIGLIRRAAFVVGLIATSDVAAQRATSARTLELSEASIADVQEALTAGRATSVQVVQQYLARIAAYEQAGPALNALIRINPRALQEAARLDDERRAGKVRGPMHGIPVIVKDNYDTGDMPTSAGTLALATSQPAADGFLVQKLRAAGAIIIAKSNLHELAAGITSISSLGGQTRNPYDPTRCPGGSSGGTGAAIAASFATVGWGSDTCGSIRIPSAFNALVGLRPTQGLVSRRGIVPLSHTQDIGGPLARTVTDLAIALDVSVGYDAGDSATYVLRDRPTPKFHAALDRNALRGARVGVFLPYFRDTDAEIADTVRAAIAAMRLLGATVIDVPMAEFDTLIASTSVTNMETKFDLIAYLKTVPDAPVGSLREILDRGLFDRQLEARLRTADTVSVTNSEAHRVALMRQSALRARMTRLLDSLSLDALAYPTMRQKPALLGEVQNGGTCNLGAQSGLPSISVPAGFSADGLPIGVELLGAGFTDTRLVALAYAFEQSGSRRVRPSTTPALVGGRAPMATPIVVVTNTRDLTVITRLTVDRVASVVRWSATVRRANQQATLSALVLRRTSVAGQISGPTASTGAGGTVISRITIPENSSRVTARLLGPNQQRGSGSFPLTFADRTALDAGRLSLALYTNAGVRPVEVKVRAK